MPIEDRVDRLERALQNTVDPNSLTANQVMPSGGTVVVVNPTSNEFETVPKSDFITAQPQFNDVLDLENISGAITIDWNDAIKHKMNITGNSTITFTNFAAYEGIKVQELQIKSSSPSNTITWSNGVDISLLEGDTIDFSSTGKVNNISVRLLRRETPDGVFQISNLVR